MVNASFQRYYDELVKPRAGMNPAPQSFPKAPADASEEAQMMIAAFEGSMPRPNYDDPAVRQQIRAIMEAMWGSVSNFLEFDFTSREEEMAGVNCTIFTPANLKNQTQKLLYLHGGAYWLGSPTANSAVALKMAHHSGLEVISVDYRLAPEYPHPAGRDDAVAVYGALLGQGYNAHDIAMFGDSAGGGLALMAALELRDHSSLPLPAALGLSCPWVDMAMDGDSYHTVAPVDPMLSVSNLAPAAAGYAGNLGVSALDVNAHKADLTGLPPMIIQVGTRDMLLSDAIRIAKQARLCGVEVEFEVFDGMWHVWHATPGLPEAEKATLDIATFLCDHMG